MNADYSDTLAKAQAAAAERETLSDTMREFIEDTARCVMCKRREELARGRRGNFGFICANCMAEFSESGQ